MYKINILRHSLLDKCDKHLGQLLFMDDMKTHLVIQIEWMFHSIQLPCLTFRVALMFILGQTDTAVLRCLNTMKQM